MIRTSLINGVINLDSDFSKYIESLSNPGVIEGFNVQDGVVKPGKARVKAERTNGETIYCYVENTEDVSLSGNDGKVYIVIDQEDIDSGLVSEDGSNIARIEEGEVRPEKNFLKIWSKNGGLIVDEREMVKKINEVDEDLEEEISGIDTRLTEAEHDIQQIIEQSGSALSYLDTTCYAGEEIHENDLIVTNGNSFNPDRTDEDLSVGGITVNKYAIGFIGNGESTDTFSIKTSVIEGFEPDSVTINIESDDNGKPSGTALATSSSLDVFKSNTSLSDLVDVGSSQTIYDSIQRFYFSNLGENEGNISYDKTTGIITVSGETYNYTLDISGVTGYVASMDLCNISPCDKYLYFNLSNSLYQLYLPNYFSTEGAEITQITAELSSSVNKQKRGAFDRTGHFFAINCADVNNDYKRGILYTETPFDLTNYTVVYNETSYRALGFAFMEYLGNSFVAFTGYYSSGHAYKGRIIKLNPDGTIEQSEQFIQSYYSGSDNDHIRCDIREKENIIYWKQNASSGYYAKKLGLERDYNYNLAKTFTVGSSVSATKGTKYRLTITPVVTGSVVDSVKIHDKEGEYFSTCMVKDTDISHDWSTVANKTPYIDSSCILARYARKEKEGDTFSNACGGFANGDFTELENVQYTFKGLKTGFNGLESDTAYYSTGDGGIAKDGAGTYVGKAPNDTSLLVDIDSNRGWMNEDRTVTAISTDTTTYEIIEPVMRNERIKIVGYGLIIVYSNGKELGRIARNSNASDTIVLPLFAGDTLRITYKRYVSGSDNYSCSGTITFF